MLDIFIINANKYINNNPDRFLEILDEYETIRYNAIQKIKDKNNYLLERYTLKKIISEYTNQKLNNIKFEYNKFGKPKIRNKFIYFNLSHSEDYLVIGMSKKQIGIDIEKIKYINLEIAKSFCTEKEIRYIYDNNNQYDIFYRLWTLKESFVKNVGKGLYFDVKRLNFNIDNKSKIKLNIDNKLSKSFQFFTKNIRSNILSVCYSEKYQKPNILSFNNIQQII